MKIEAETLKNSPELVKEYFERPEVVLGTMYAIVAGFAFTEAIRVYHDQLTRGLILANLRPDVIFRLISFFTLAIPFYHGGVLLLLKAKEEIKKGILWEESEKRVPKKNKERHIEIHTLQVFIMIFLHGIILYFIGTNIYHIHFFSSLIIFLLGMNSAWLYYMWAKLGVQNVAIEWIQLNAVTLGFFASFLFLPYSLVSKNSLSISLSFLAVLAARAILDYLFAWSLVYARKRPEEENKK